MSTPSIYSALKKLRQLLTREDKRSCLTMAAFSLTNSLLEVTTAFVIVLLAQILNQPQVGQHYLNKLGLHLNVSLGRIVFYMALLVGFIYLIKNIVAAVEAFNQNFTIQKMNYHFKNKLLLRYAQMDYGVYLTRNSSLGVQVISGDVEQMFSNGLISMAIVFSESVVFLALTGMIVYMNPSLALILFTLGVVFSWVIIKGMLPRFYHYGRQFQQASLYASQNLVQFFHAFKEIVILRKRETFISKYQTYSHQKSRIYAKQTSINLLPRLVIELLFISLFIVAIAFLSWEQQNSAKMMGILGGYLYAGFRLMPGLNRIISQLNIFKATIPAIDRVYYEYTETTVKENYKNITDFQYNHGITLHDVCFKYLNTSKNALSHFSLEIKKGECIGIVGETGSGKSTLVDLILGLLKPQQGSILIDNCYPVDSYQWHQKIGYVPQSIYLTDDTIAANIAFGEQDVNEDQLNYVIDAAQLRTFIDALPQGVKTIVGERGVRLSGGERQRIAIARALYHNPEVLIFDEATSALDNETEARLMTIIHQLSQTRTVIMIAHRLTTLKNCQRIIVMEKGRLKDIVQYKQMKTEVAQNA